MGKGFGYELKWVMGLLGLGSRKWVRIRIMGIGYGVLGIGLELIMG